MEMSNMEVIKVILIIALLGIVCLFCILGIVLNWMLYDMRKEQDSDGREKENE